MDGELVAMQPQVFDLLVHLLKHRDHVVSRDDLIALGLGRPDRLGLDARQPYQRRAERNRRQRQGAEADPNHSAKGHSLRRRRERTTGQRPADCAGSGRHRTATPAVAAAGPAGDCRTAVRQHERRPGAGVFFRRNQRGHHHRAVEIALVLRDRPQLVVHLQGQGGAYEAGRRRTRGALRRRRQREKERRSRAHHRAAQRHRDRQSYLGGTLRPRPASTCSPCRTRSPTPSSRRSSRRSMPRRIFAAGASRPTAWTRGIW